MSNSVLGSVARERRETCKEGKAGYPVVGLEHLVPEEVTLSSWEESGDNTFTKRFHKGDVLFGRRSAYLKKAVVAPFDGICSGDITVIEPDPDQIIPELLPFIIQNDSFFDYAVGKSAGSLSPRVKWEHLKNYEFFLPDTKKQQQELADLLWSMDAAKKSYQKLLTATDELVKSQFIEITQGGNGTPTSMGDIATYVNGYAFKPQDWSYKGLPIIRIQNLNDVSADFNRFAGEIDEKYLVHNGDVLISWATHLEAYLWNGGDAWLNQHIFKAVFNKRKVNKVFFIFAANYALKEAFKKAHGFKATMEHIRRGDFEEAIVMMPDLYQQEQFAALVRQSDKSKFAALSCSNLNFSGSLAYPITI